MGRPDAADALKAAEFGRQVARRLSLAASPAGLAPPRFPGNRPYVEMGRLPALAPVADRERCTSRGLSAGSCPVGAIRDDASADEETCILCHACVRVCPNWARLFLHPRL